MSNVQNSSCNNCSWENMDTHFLKVLEDPWYKLIAEIENVISNSTVEFYRKKGIKTLHLPITTNSISSPMGLGSDSSPVKVNLEGVDTYLADSMQFMLEYGCRIFEKGAYYIMPSFRGELADERHLCQFYHSEAEIPGTLDDVIKLVEEYISALSVSLLDQLGDKLLKYNHGNAHIEKLAGLSKPLPRVTLDEAEKLFKDEKEKYITYDPLGFRNINRHGEEKLMSLFDGMVWITHYDNLSVPFYQCFDKNDKTKAINADLLMGIGETVGSGERHENASQVEEALKMHKLDKSEYEWYFTMKEKYPMKTSGFGMGIERFILWLLDHKDIRDCQILPRMNGVNIIP